MDIAEKCEIVVDAFQVVLYLISIFFRFIALYHFTIGTDHSTTIWIVILLFYSSFLSIQIIYNYFCSVAVRQFRIFLQYPNVSCILFLYSIPSRFGLTNIVNETIQYVNYHLYSPDITICYSRKCPSNFDIFSIDFTISFYPLYIGCGAI